MSEQIELPFEVPSPVLLKPAAGRAEPVIWVKTLAIYKDWPLTKENELRTLRLHKGLNILWAKAGAVNQDNPTRPSKISGHATGKTTFCRLMRYVLGDRNYGSQRAREAFQAKFSSGWVLAEVMLTGELWVIGRPLGRIGHHPFAIKGQNLYWLKDQEHRPAAGFSDYEGAISAAALNDCGTRTLATTGTELRWDLVLQWLSRDQESRFADLLTWRSKASESEAEELAQPDKQNLIRIILGFVTDEEQDLIRKHAAASEKHRAAIGKRVQHNYQVETDTLRLAALFGIVAGETERLFSEGVFEQHAARINDKVGELSKALPVPADLARLRERVEKLDVAVARAADDFTEVQQLVSSKKAKLEVAQGKASKATQIAGIHSLPPSAGSCSQPLDEAWRSRCPLAKTRIEDEDIRKALEVAQTEEDFVAVEVKQLERQLASRKAKLDERQMDRAPVAAELRRLESDQLRIQNEIRPHEDRLKVAEQLRRNLREALQAQETNEGEIKSLESQKSLLDAQLDSSKTLHILRMGDFSRLYDFLVKELLGAEVTAKVDFAGKSIEPTVEFHGRLDSAALETVRLLAFDLTSMTSSIIGSGHHPRFLMHDSPREADLSQGIYQSLFLYAQRLVQEAGGPHSASFQYIITTTEPPPLSQQTPDWLICEPLDASKPETRLLRVDF